MVHVSPGTDQDVDAVLVHGLHLAGVTRLRRHGVDIGHTQLLLLLVLGHPRGSLGPSGIGDGSDPEPVGWVECDGWRGCSEQVRTCPGSKAPVESSVGGKAY